MDKFYHCFITAGGHAKPLPNGERVGASASWSGSSWVGGSLKDSHYQLASHAGHAFRYFYFHISHNTYHCGPAVLGYHFRYTRYPTADHCGRGFRFALVSLGQENLCHPLPIRWVRLSELTRFEQRAD